MSLLFPDYAGGGSSTELIDDNADGYTTILGSAGHTLTAPASDLSSTKSLDFEVYLLNPVWSQPLVRLMLDGATTPAMTIRAFWRRTTGSPSAGTNVTSEAILGQPANSPMKIWIHGRLSLLTGFYHASIVVSRDNGGTEEAGETQFNGGFFRGYSAPTSIAVNVFDGLANTNVDAGSWMRLTKITQ